MSEVERRIFEEWICVSLRFHVEQRRYFLNKEETLCDLGDAESLQHAHFGIIHQWNSRTKVLVVETWIDCISL